MKNRSFIASLAFALLCVAADTALAQVQTGGRFTLEGAAVPGGAMRGGRFDMTASVNPPVAGTIKASRFQLIGGQLSPVTVEQVPNGPELQIQLLPDGRIRLSWAADGAKHALQGTTDPVHGTWQRLNLPIETTETGSIVIVDPSDAIRVYRLGR
jgi:hypothetical protein